MALSDGDREYQREYYRRVRKYSERDREYKREYRARPEVRERHAAEERARRARIPDVNRAYNLLLLYGLSNVEYEAMAERQGGVCAICRKPETRKANEKSTRLAVDHDHETGRVRGLICSACNTGIGYFRDDPALLLRAAAYLGGTGPVWELQRYAAPGYSFIGGPQADSVTAADPTSPTDGQGERL